MSCNSHHKKLPNKSNVLIKMTIEDLILQYLNGENGVDNKSEEHKIYLSKLKSITDFLCGEINNNSDPNYRKFHVEKNHQRFLNSKKGKVSAENFIEYHENSNPIKDYDFEDFEELFAHVSNKSFDLIGPTCIYDFCLRFGWNRNTIANKPKIEPEKYVYFHSGPLRTAILLRLLISTFPLFERNPKKDSFRIAVADLYRAIPEFKKYKMCARDLEHFLCTYFNDIKMLVENKIGRIINEEDIKLKKSMIKK